MQAQPQTQQWDYTPLDAYIDSLSTKKGALIAVLHKAQELYGYLPEPLQHHISRQLDIPASKVFGVVTFYAYLKMEPQGRIPINVCLGTACFVRGAEDILKEFEKQLDIPAGGMTSDTLFSLASIRCVGACGLAPVVMMGDRIFGRLTTEDVKGIVDEYMAKGDAHA